MTNRAQEFAEQLTRLETTGEVGAFVAAVFAADATLVRPEIDREFQGSDGAQTFWQEYLGQFAQIRSTFGRVIDGEVAVLEWTSSGQLSSGSDISYAGVSLLDFDEEGRVCRFATYYDTAAFDARSARDDVA